MVKKISIITPCYNEEANVEECYKKIKEIFKINLKDYSYEHIFCDNNSSDKTLLLLKEIAKKDKNVKIIVNSRNFGAFNSMFNGMLAASGDAVIPLVPADLQDPPELIPEFVSQWSAGYEVVYGIRNVRNEPFLMHKARSIYYRIVNRFANIDIPLNAGEFTLIDKKVHDALKQYEDYYPYLRGMIANCGFRSVLIPYVWKVRERGLSKANWYTLIDAGLNGLISFTNIPMRLCMFSGFLIAAGSISYSFFIFFSILFFKSGDAIAGIPTITIALFFLFGITLFFLGILGEYVSAIHFQVRKRPLVIERERINF
jgi:glycosyltransferase involved in cell wall biosynthesis